MRIIELINLSMQYNELLVKYTKWSIWVDNPNVSQEKKKEFIPKLNGLLKEMDVIIFKFEKNGITFDEYEGLECLELPNNLKRKDVEIYLEYHYKNKRFDNMVNKNSEENYIMNERDGMQL